MPKKDTRKISLDPMEWRDAMRDVVGKKSPVKPPAKKPTQKNKKK